MTGRTLRIAIRRDWLPDECIVALPTRLRIRAIRAGIESGRLSVNRARELAVISA